MISSQWERWLYVFAYSQRTHVTRLFCDLLASGHMTGSSWDIQKLFRGVYSAASSCLQQLSLSSLLDWGQSLIWPIGSIIWSAASLSWQWPVTAASSAVCCLEAVREMRKTRRTVVSSETTASRVSWSWGLETCWCLALLAFCVCAFCGTKVVQVCWFRKKVWMQIWNENMEISGADVWSSRSVQKTSTKIKAWLHIGSFGQWDQHRGGASKRTLSIWAEGVVKPDKSVSAVDLRSVFPLRI